MIKKGNFCYFFLFNFFFLKGITIESLFKELKSNSNLIQFWDELSTFIGSFGMYKQTNGSFDKSIILTMYNGVNLFSASYKSVKYNFKKPRLSIFTAGHPEKVIGMLEDEKSVKSDGFISRFLVCCPKPKRLRLTELKEFDNEIDFKKLLVSIYLMHNESIEYVFDQEGFTLLDDILHEYDTVCEKFEMSNNFFGYFGKNISEWRRQGAATRPPK